jgi:hypothetical protein
MAKKKINDQTQEIKIRPQHETKRGHWYLLSGLVLGIAAGLIFTWLLFPVVYENTSPGTLAEDYKEIYRRTIAEVYVITGDLDRAISRLNLLENDDIVFALGAQAQRALADGREKEAQALAILASAIQSGQSAEGSTAPQVTPSTLPNEPGLPTQTLPQLTPNP